MFKKHPVVSGKLKLAKTGKKDKVWSFLWPKIRFLSFLQGTGTPTPNMPKQCLNLFPGGGLLSPKSYVDVPAEPRKSDFSIPIVVGYTGVMFQKA